MRRTITPVGLSTVALLLALAAREGEGQSTKPLPKKPTIAPASAVGAPRARAVSTPAGRAVNTALKTALADAKVRNAVRAEVLRQLRVRRPLAVANGYLAHAIDLKSVYQAPDVRPALLAALGGNGPQLINQAGLSADRLTLVFVPATFGKILLPQFTNDITATVGVDALKAEITDIGPIVMIVVLAGSGLGIVISLAESLAAFLDWAMAEDTPVYPEGPTYDFDNDGLMNMDDPDDDGDGVNDDKDNYPYDPERSICDCGRPQPTFSLTGGRAGDFLPALLQFQNVAQRQNTRGVSLGTLLQGRSNQLVAIF